MDISEKIEAISNLEAKKYFDKAKLILKESLEDDQVSVLDYQELYQAFLKKSSELIPHFAEEDKEKFVFIHSTMRKKWTEVERKDREADYVYDCMSGLDIFGPPRSFFR